MRALHFALTCVALATTGTAQIRDFPGPSANIAAPAIDFDNPFVPSGPVPSNVYAGTGITSVTQVGSGWNPAGAILWGSGHKGQILASQNGTPAIVGHSEPLDHLGPGDGWEILLDQPVDEFQLSFPGQSGFGYDVELFLGATSLGVGRFVYQDPPMLRFFRATGSQFDRVLITVRFVVWGRGIDDLGFGNGPPPPPPTNDECATRIAVLQGSTPFATHSATLSPEPWSCAAPTGGDIWFEYTTATPGMDLQIDVCESFYDTALEIYTGTCGALTLVACNDDSCFAQSRVVLPGIVAGTTYLIRLGGATASLSHGTLKIAESVPPPLPPDDCMQTYFISNGGGAAGGAVYFDLDSIADVSISGLELNTSSTAPLGLEVYVIPGTYAGNTGNPSGAGWILAATDDGNAVGLGQDERSPIEFASPWLLPAGAWGVALVGSNSVTGRTLDHDYAHGTGFNEHFASADGQMSFQAGAADDVPWTGGLVAPVVWNGILCHTPTPIGTNYCQANPNATGVPGVMSATGSLVVTHNNLTLHASELTFMSFGYFLTSSDQGFVMNPGGSAGNLCLGGTIGRYVGPGQIQNSGSTGTVSAHVDLTEHPTPTGLVQVNAGETWSFTLWYRETNAGMATSNFADGLEISFR